MSTDKQKKRSLALRCGAMVVPTRIKLMVAWHLMLGEKQPPDGKKERAQYMTEWRRQSRRLNSQRHNS